MTVSVGPGWSIGAGVTLGGGNPGPLVIPLSDTGGVTGWNPQAAGIPYSAPHILWAVQSLFKTAPQQLLHSGMTMVLLTLTFFGIRLRLAQYSQSH